MTSGLEVDALGGAPGVYSARYAGPGASDADRYRKLLDALAGVPWAERTARFRCVVAVAVARRAQLSPPRRVRGDHRLRPRGRRRLRLRPRLLPARPGPHHGPTIAGGKARHQPPRPRRPRHGRNAGQVALFVVPADAGTTKRVRVTQSVHLRSNPFLAAPPTRPTFAVP